MSLEDLEDPIVDKDDEGGAAPLVVGQKKQRVPLWINEDWRPDNEQPLLEDRERGIAYWVDKSTVQRLVEFVREASR